MVLVETKLSLILWLHGPNGLWLFNFFKAFKFCMSQNQGILHIVKHLHSFYEHFLSKLILSNGLKTETLIRWVQVIEHFELKCVKSKINVLKGQLVSGHLTLFSLYFFKSCDFLVFLYTVYHFLKNSFGLQTSHWEGDGTKRWFKTIHLHAAIHYWPQLIE